MSVMETARLCSPGTLVPGHGNPWALKVFAALEAATFHLRRAILLQGNNCEITEK